MRISSAFFVSWTLAAVASVSTGCGKDEPVAPRADTPTPEAGVSSDVSDTDPAPASDTDETDEVPTRPTSTATPSPAPVTASDVGKRCQLDDDCATGLRCLTTDTDEWLGGGAPNGYCSQDCFEDPTVCGAGLCLQTSDSAAYCVEQCELGFPDPSKCHGREDLSCTPLRAADGSFLAYCSPTCRNDADCDGRKCDLGWGNCIDELPEGAPIGAQCEQDSDCQTSFCYPTELADGSQHAVCSGACTLGATAGCGLAQSIAEEPGQPVCLPPISGLSAGDLGLCQQSCNCNEQCLHPNAVCLIFPDDSGAQSVFGTDGICIEPLDVPEEELNGLVLGRSCPPGPDMGDGGMSPLPDPPEAGTEPETEPAPVVPDAATPLDSGAEPTPNVDASAP